MKERNVAGFFSRMTEHWRGDLFGGVTAAVVALPLALAFGVLSGAGPMAGLYGAVFTGILAAIFGGSPAQVSGPTAGMTVVLVPIYQEFGLTGLYMAMFLGSALLLLLSFLKVGRYVHLISQPVLSGFTNGIALLIFLQQIDSLRGASGAIVPAEAALAGAVVAIMLVWPRITRKIPGSLVALVLSTAAVRLFWPEVFTTIGPIPGGWPTPQLAFFGELANLGALLRPALTIALLGAVESLLSAVVVDEMAGTRHDPDRELFGQGLGNMVATLFGGIVGTGAIVRSAASIQAGGRTRLAAVTHGLVILLVAVALGDLAGLIPRATLAGILMGTAINMVDRRSLADMRRVPVGDAAIMLTTAAITVVFDLVTAVAVGVLLSMIRFAVTVTDAPLTVKRMGKVTVIRLTGPLYFGAAKPFLDAVDAVPEGSTLVLDLRGVTSLDATGAQALERGYARATARGCEVIWTGVQPQVHRVLSRWDRLPVQLTEQTS
ncbi:SulP family inorganic anion transporter [Symbiobacterium thermophilum]|uniref:STAS domain-containing protein n=1 Tax=Symbiobacterium thermophilum TaxID=2734 RepID=A0A953LJW9_SYMTR|nr:SulP family inorganic anion transporter [Symbiobacterium thermophilum]MBY6276352.1 hypothetical protein [Symbiobacterium thermophilum]